MEHTCRLCLDESDPSHIDLLCEKNYMEMIETLTGIQVKPKEGLPTIACFKCCQEVRAAIEIKRQIINSHNTLLKKLEQLKTDFQDAVINNPINELEPKKSELMKNAKEEIKFKRKKLEKSNKMQQEIKPEHQQLLKTVGRKDRVPCPECKREIFGINLKNHLITHNYAPVYCDVCGKMSKNAQALQDHINYYHKTTPDRFICDKCGKGYRVRFMLERHEKKEHGSGQKDYECRICGKKFFEKMRLDTHIKITHNKIKPYKCEFCGKDFGRRTQFVTHQLVHTKENRFHCQVCGKGFKIKQSMQTHLKGIHGIEEEKTIFCQICRKGFSTQQGLRAHVNSRVHGLEKCTHCSEFVTLEFKSVHLKEIHGMEQTEAKGFCENLLSHRMKISWRVTSDPEPKEYPEIITGNCSNAKDQDMAFHEVVRKDPIPLIFRNTTSTWYGDEQIYCVKIMNEYLKRYGTGGGTAFIKSGGLGHHYVTIEMHSEKGGGMEFIIFLYGKKHHD